MDECCPYCDLTYDVLRTGYTYSDIYQMFWSGSDDPSDWVNKRRNTILGRWRQIKMSMWVEHLETCERETDYIANLATQECADALGDIYDLSHAAVPF